MSLILWGSLSAATDATMSAAVEKSGSQTRASISELVEQVAAAIVGGDPLVAAAAAAAVSDALADQDILIGSDERAMKYGATYAHRIKDTSGKVAFGVRQDGSTYAPDFEARRARIAGMTATESADGSWTIKDSAGKIAFKVDSDGRTLIGDLHPSSNLSGASAGTAVSRVLILWVMGQSNAAGRGLPIGPRLDPKHPRIKMSLWSGTTVTGIGDATVPVSNQQLLSSSGLDPATVIARQIVAEQDDVLVVICNAAKGGSGLVFDTSNGVWQVGYSGANTAQFPIATAALTKTRTDVEALYPGLPIDVQIVWHQGESDGTIPYSEYSPALQTLIGAARSHLGDATAPFVMGGTVPEDSNATEEANIMAAQIQAQADVLYTAFAYGVSNGGGSAAPSGDKVHYHRAGVEELGARMYRELRRAYVNNTTSVPQPSLEVTGRWRKSVGILEIAWQFPMCRATSFVVQYQVDNGSWVTVPERSRPLDTFATVTGINTGNEIRVRVATVNEVGTSSYTAAVTAIGA